MNNTEWEFGGDPHNKSIGYLTDDRCPIINATHGPIVQL